MIYTIISKKPETGDKAKIFIRGPIRIKVPNRSAEEDPYLGFATKELGEAYLRIKKFPEEDFCVVPMKNIVEERNTNKSVLVYENEAQILDAEKDTEGYDYESLIHPYTL